MNCRLERAPFYVYAVLPDNEGLTVQVANVSCHHSPYESFPMTVSAIKMVDKFSAIPSQFITFNFVYPTQLLYSVNNVNNVGGFRVCVSELVRFSEVM
jgi:hypothetical protein